MRYLRVILTVCLIFTAYVGDYIVFNSRYSSSNLFRAICDNAVHAAIGFLSAGIFFGHENNLKIQSCLLHVLLCTIISSLIDIDHFIVAKSIHFKDLSNLKQRGLFHCTTFWVLITVILLAYSYETNNPDMYRLTFVFIIAYVSHHTRDANRRGFWLYPFGHTPALYKNFYVFILAVFPHILIYVYSSLKDYFYKTVNYAIIV